MAGLSGLTRAAEWWSYKIPPLIAIAYALVLTGGREPAVSIPLVIAGAISIIAVAAYGYVINDCFDIEVDRRAGKKNSMAGRPVWQRGAILAAILLIGWAPAVVVDYPILASVLLALDFTLPTIYSIPPIRLKERGVWGILSDALAAHLLPTLFLASLLVLGNENVGLYQYGLVAVLAAWYLCVGLRGIITHQILDREADIASGVVTLATSQDSIRLLRWDRRILYLAEMVFFVSMVALLSRQTYLLVPVFFVFLFLESLMRIMKWGYFVEKTPLQGKRFYLPFANNLFYSLWLPLVLAVECAIRWPILFIVPIAHYVIFSRGRGREHREPIEVLRDSFHELRRYVFRRRFGWNVIVDRSRWPIVDRYDETFPAIKVHPQRKLPQPWDLRLHSERYPLSKGESYQLQLFLRADAPRVVTVGVCQGYSPWKDLGFADIVPLTTKWEHFHFDFTATATDASGAIFIWVGGHEAPVDIGEARLVRVTDPGPWKLVLTKPAQAWRSPPNDRSYLVRIDRIKTDGVPWHIRLTSRSFRVRKGQTYRVRVSLRSEFSRRVTFGVSQAYPPFDVAGLCEEVVIPEMFEDYQGEFVAVRDEEVTVFFWLGSDSSIVEILSVECQALILDRMWNLDRAEGCLAWRVTTDSPERVIVNVAGPAADAEKIAIWTSLDLGTRAEWIVRCQLRTLYGQQQLRYAVIEQVDDRWRSLAVGEFDTSESTEGMEIRFFAIDPARPHRFVLWAGDIDDMVIIDDFSLIPASPWTVWQLEAEPSAKGKIEYPSESLARIVALGELGRDFAVRAVGVFVRPAPQAQRVTFTLRADAPRPVTIAFEEKSSSFEDSRSVVVSCATAVLDSSWQEITLLLPARDQVSDVIWVPSLRIGESPIAVECQGMKIDLVDPSAYWRLDASGGAKAHFGLPVDKRSACRLNMIEPGAQPAELQLSHPISPGEFRRPTRFTFMLRADQPREVWIGMGEGTEPWRPIVAPQRMQVDVDWTTHVFFADPASMKGEKFSSLRIFIWLGGDSNSIEWQGISSHELGPSELPLSLASTPAATVRYEVSGEPSRVGVVPVEPGSAPFDAQVQVALPAIQEGKTYRLTATLGSDSPRSVIVAVNRSCEPWDSLGLSRTVWLRSTAEALVWDFQASACDEQPRLVIAIGGDRTPIEVGPIMFREVDRPHSPIIRTGEELCRRASVAGEPDAVRFHLEATDDPWGIKLASGAIALQGGQRYALSALLRAEGERSILLGAGESNPPWSMPFPPTKLSIGPQWRHFLFLFVADRDVSSTEALLCLGGNDAAVDVGSLSIEPTSAPSTWKLETTDDRAVRVVSPADWAGESFDVASVANDPWRVKLTTEPLAVEQGAKYHVGGRFRAEPARTITIGLAQNHEPWDGLGFFEKVQVGSEAIEWEATFEASRSEEDAIIFIWLGDATGRLDVSDWQWERKSADGSE